MKNNKTSHKQFYAIVELPDVLIPWADRFYEPVEIELVILLGREALGTEDIRVQWPDDSAHECPPDLERVLERSFKRGVLKKRPGRQYAAADFHTRYDIWALFESWQDIPDDVQESLNQWELSYYVSTHRKLVDDLKKGKKRDTLERWPEYLLPHEAEALIDAVEQVYLWPCNCRAMFGRCRKPIYTCLRFSNNRGIGWEISKSRAKKIMQEANRKGLMQSGEISISPDGRVGGALCNCCADCCFPHLLTKPLGAEKLWPLTRYVARSDRERCTACGRCVRRCPFNAITLDTQADEKEKFAITIDAALCRGCGLCSTGCRDDAIDMIKLEDVDSLYDKLVV